MTGSQHAHAVRPIFKYVYIGYTARIRTHTHTYTRKYLYISTLPI
jgi:hypothetical protein